MASYRRTSSVRLLTGDTEIDQVLSQIKQSAANKMVRPAMRKVTSYLLKKIKSHVPPDKKPLKKLFGAVSDQKGSGYTQRAKVGAAVGKAGKIKNAQNRSGQNRGGVGISARNIHWLILGTGPRNTKKGKYTGLLQPLDMVKEVVSQERATIANMLRDELKRRLEVIALNEAKKAAKASK